MTRAEVRGLSVEGDWDLLSGCHIYNNKITSLPQHPKPCCQPVVPAGVQVQNVTRLLQLIGFLSHKKKRTHKGNTCTFNLGDTFFKISYPR